MKTSPPPTNEFRHADSGHPIDLRKPRPERKRGIQSTSEILSQIFGWVAEGNTLEQKGLRASVVLYCVRADLIEEVTLEELSIQAGFSEACVEKLITEFCHTINWK